MAVPTSITELSTTAASNSPSGSENVFPNLDDYLRATSSFIASIRDNSSTNGWVSPYITGDNPTLTGKIQGDLSNATYASRLYFQTTTVNGLTAITGLPNGTATTAQVDLLNSATPDTGSTQRLTLRMTETEAAVASQLGAGSTYLPLSFYTGGTEALRIDTSGVASMRTGALQELKRALTTNDIDVRTGNCFSKTISGPTTFTVSGVPAAGGVASLILDLTNGGSHEIAWWSGVKWAGGAMPSLTAAGRDVLVFFTHDGGTTWSGLVVGRDLL